MKQGYAIAIAGAAVMLASPALAGERWLVYTGGEKPGRIFVVVDETYLDAVPFTEKTYKLETVTVLENAKAPDWVSSNMIIDCGRNTLEEKLIQVSPRGEAHDRARPAGETADECGWRGADRLRLRHGTQE